MAVSYWGAPHAATQLINASNPGWEALTGRMDVPFRRPGRLMVALNADDEQRLRALSRDADFPVSGRAERAAEPMRTPSDHASVNSRNPQQSLPSHLSRTVVKRRSGPCPYPPFGNGRRPSTLLS